MGKNAKINTRDGDYGYGTRDSVFGTTTFAQLESRRGFNNNTTSDVMNPYVNFNNHPQSQELHDMMSAEAIQMYGIRCVYIRRTMNNVDLVYGEDPLSVFTENFPVAFWLESFSGTEGEGDMASAFGLVVNDEINLIANSKLFHHQGDGKQLAEGDLIYIPMSNSLFEINWVEVENSEYYQVGSIPNRRVTASKFVYSGEEINVEGDELLPVNNLGNSWDDSLLIPGEEMQEMIEDYDRFDLDDETGVPEQSGEIDLDEDGYLDDINNNNIITNPFDNEF